MTSDALPRQAVILAGGQGSRLRPHTDTRPKAMIEIAGRCIVDYQIEWLAESGVTDVTVSACHLHEVLSEHLTSNPQLTWPRVVEGYRRAIDTAKDITEAAAELRSAAQPPP